MFTDADEAYYQRMIGVLEFTKDEELTVINRCPECGEVPEDQGIGLHRVYEGVVIIGCEGYWVFDPEMVGMGTGNWMDFRDDMEDLTMWLETGLRS